MIFLHLNLAIQGARVGDSLIKNCRVLITIFILKASIV
jgi:hypothetical protein